MPMDADWRISHAYVGTVRRRGIVYSVYDGMFLTINIMCMLSMTNYNYACKLIYCYCTLTVSAANYYPLDDVRLAFLEVTLKL